MANDMANLGIIWLRDESLVDASKVRAPGVLPAESSKNSWLPSKFSGSTQRPERGVDFSAMAFIACCPSSFVIVEFGEELESSADARFPRSDVDGPGEHADRVWLVVAFASMVEHFVGVGGLGSSSVVDDIAPHLQHPQPPHQGLVDDPIGELVEVVQVSAECDSSVPGEFLGAGLGLGHDWKYRQCEAVLLVDR